MTGRRGFILMLALMAADCGQAAASGWRVWAGVRWDYRLLHQDNGERIQRLPLGLDSLSSPGLIFYCHEQSPHPSSIQFLDPLSGLALPPFYHPSADSSLSFGVPLAARVPGRRPPVAVMAESRMGSGELLVYASMDSLSIDAEGGHSYRPLPALGPDGEPRRRTLEAQSPVPDLLRERHLLLDFGDLAPEREGLEVLVQGWWASRRSSSSRTELVLMGLEDWLPLWRLPLPTAPVGLLEDPLTGGWLGLTRATGNGVSASGLVDTQAWLFRVDGKGRLSGALSLEACPAGVEPGLEALPAEEGFLLFVGGPVEGKAGGRIEHRRWLDLSVVAARPVAGCVDALTLGPAPPAATGWRVALLTQDDGLRLLDHDLEPLAEADPGEACTLIGWGPLPEGGRGLAAGTASGRLLLFDEDLDLFSDQRVWTGALSARGRAREGRRFTPYVKDGEWIWGVNTARGSLHGTWSRHFESGHPFVMAGALAGLVLLVLALCHTTLRWRHFRAVVRTLFRQSDDGVLILDNHWRLIDGNERGMAFLGLDPAREGRARRLIVWLWKWLGEPARHRPALDDLVRGQPLEALWTHLRKDGGEEGDWSMLLDQRPVDVLFRFQPIRGERLRHGWVLTLQDITRHLDGQRQKVWSMVAQNAAHRLNSPLQSLMLKADAIFYRLLERDQRPLDDAAAFTVLTQVEQIVDRAREMEKVIQEFLAVSDREIQLAPLHLGDFLRRHVAKYQEKYARPDVVISLTLSDDLPPLQADAFHLLSALMNLLDNALKAIRGQGEIRVRATRHSDPDWVALDVEDNGVGIAADQLQRIFSPHISDFGDGHGLGLTHARGIVEAHGGRLTVSSRLGEGSCFRIILPIRQKES